MCPHRRFVFVGDLQRHSATDICRQRYDDSMLQMRKSIRDVHRKRAGALYTYVHRCNWRRTTRLRTETGHPSSWLFGALVRVSGHPSHVMTSTLAPQNQHRNVSPAHMR